MLIFGIFLLIILLKFAHCFVILSLNFRGPFEVSLTVAWSVEGIMDFMEKLITILMLPLVKTSREKLLWCLKKKVPINLLIQVKGSLKRHSVYSVIRLEREETNRIHLCQDGVMTPSHNLHCFWWWSCDVLCSCSSSLPEGGAVHLFCVFFSWCCVAGNSWWCLL